MAVDLPPGWMRQIIGASPRRPMAAQRDRCRGFFWDNINHRQIVLDLGKVTAYVRNVFRAASLEDEPQNVLSWELGLLEEGAAQNTEIPFFADPEFPAAAGNYPTKKVGRSRQYPTNPKGFFSPGSVVIPGQSLMGETKAQKNTPGQSAMGRTFAQKISGQTAMGCRKPC